MSNPTKLTYSEQAYAAIAERRRREAEELERSRQDARIAALAAYQHSIDEKQRQARLIEHQRAQYTASYLTALAKPTERPVQPQPEQSQITFAQIAQALAPQRSSDNEPLTKKLTSLGKFATSISEAISDKVLTPEEGEALLTYVTANMVKGRLDDILKAMFGSAGKPWSFASYQQHRDE